MNSIKLVCVLVSCVLLGCDKDAPPVALQPPASRATVMLDAEADVDDIELPAEFNYCSGTYLNDTTESGRTGWTRGTIDSVAYLGKAYYLPWPPGSDRYRIDIILYDQESCFGLFQMVFGDTGLAVDDPYNGSPYGNIYSPCDNADGRATKFTPPRPWRYASLTYLTHDAPLQYLGPDSMGIAQLRLYVDQVDTVKGFIRGRYGGRFMAGPNCDEERRVYGDAAYLDEGYFEAAAYRL